MTHFLKQANTFKPVADAAIDVHSKLPPGNYTIKQDAFGNFFFEQVEAFELSHKIYGDTLRNCDRIMNTFLDRPAATGVMLTGEKGSGKTLLAKSLSIKAAALGYPTIIINTDWHGDPFNTLIQSIEQPCVILFDEFEKIYDRETHPAILTLLDGVFPSRKLFILTCNDKWRVDEHMRNRPGRIYYMLDFRGLAIEFIREYCEENLDDKNQTEPVCNASAMFSEFNFDMLKSLVEEMNRYGESAQEAIKMLNAKPSADDNGEYEVSLVLGDKTIDTEQVWPNRFDSNPLTRERFTITYYPETQAPVTHVKRRKTGNGAECMESAAPGPGDISLCIYCGTFLEYDEDIKLKVASSESITEVNPEGYAGLLRAQEYIQERLRNQL